MKLKQLSPKYKRAIEEEVKMMLHASRNCLRNQKIDTSKIRFKINDGYYNKAFGILHALKVLNYGKFGAVNHSDALNYWMRELEDQVLKEENFDGNNECDFCLEHYGKDGAGRKRT